MNRAGIHHVRKFSVLGVQMMGLDPQAGCFLGQTTEVLKKKTEYIRFTSAV